MDRRSGSPYRSCSYSANHGTAGSPVALHANFQSPSIVADIYRGHHSEIRGAAVHGAIARALGHQTTVRWDVTSSSPNRHGVTSCSQYRFLPAFAVNGFSLALPAFEIVTGLALLLTPFEAEASAAVLLLLGMFIVALGQALARNLGIACGCFDIEGAADAGETWFSLLRDCVLLVPAGWMWIKSERRFPWHF